MIRSVDCHSIKLLSFNQANWSEKYQEELFFNRKKRYAIDLCAVCDCNKKFIYFLCEWSNSQHDQRVFSADDLHQHSTSYFSSDQYLLDDSVYTNTLYVITLYKVSHTKHFEVRRFNRRLSRVRIDIEHAFGMLKDRWKSLTELRLRIRDRKNYIFAIRWITACLILHNIVLNIQNNWNEEEEWWTSENEKTHEKELKLLNDQQLIEKLNKRDHVKRLILEEDWSKSILQSSSSDIYLTTSIHVLEMKMFSLARFSISSSFSRVASLQS
jgi:hypothetical protein